MSDKIVTSRMFPADSGRVSQMLAKGNMPDDPQEPYYPQIGVIAVSGGKDVGFLTASIVNHVAFVNSIYVVPEGRRVGVASQLLVDLEQRVWVAECFHIAFKLLSKWGEELKPGLELLGYKPWKEEGGVIVYTKDLVEAAKAQAEKVTTTLALKGGG